MKKTDFERNEQLVKCWFMILDWLKENNAPDGTYQVNASETLEVRGGSAILTANPNYMIKDDSYYVDVKKQLLRAITRTKTTPFVWIEILVQEWESNVKVEILRRKALYELIYNFKP